MKFNSPIQFCISCWKVAGALQSPNGILSHSKNPRLPTVKAVYCFDASSILICQNLDFRSRQGKVAGCLLSSSMPPVFRAMDRNPSSYVHSDIGSRCRNASHCTFSLTSTTALHQVLWLGQMVPDSNISFRCFLTSFTIGGGIHLKCSLNGVLSVTFMVCLVKWVHPSSAGSNENMS